MIKRLLKEQNYRGNKENINRQELLEFVAKTIRQDWDQLRYVRCLRNFLDKKVSIEKNFSVDQIIEYLYKEQNTFRKICHSQKLSKTPKYNYLVGSIIKRGSGNIKIDQITRGLDKFINKLPDSA